jgi:hypothetical protein
MAILTLVFRVLVSGIALSLAALALALPGGAPVCTVDTATMNMNMGLREGGNPNSWQITASSVTYAPGGVTFDVRIENTGTAITNFKGLLLWATDASNNQIGTWQAPSASFQRTCSNRSITHVDANLKSEPSELFKLVLPIEQRGLITINAFVVESSRTTHREMISTHVHLDPLRNDLDVDTSLAPSRYQATTDGLLVLRYLLGLRGASLAISAKGSTAIRTDAEIERQLEDLVVAGLLDIDEDGQALPETDGLLVLRYLLGYRGDSLVAGVNAGTLSATQIAANIEALLP